MRMTETCPVCHERLVVLSQSREIRCPRGHELPEREYYYGGFGGELVVWQKTAAQIIREWKEADA